MNIGELVAHIKADTTHFTRGVNKAQAGSKKLSDSGKKTGNSMNFLNTAIRGAGITLASYFSAQAIAGVVRGIYQAGVRADQLNRSFKQATGSVSGAKREMKFLREESERLGLNFAKTADSYKNIAISAEAVGFEAQQTHKIFTSVAEASTAMGLSADQTSGALRALEQMMSKGNVQAEELRGQLGERIPGAFVDAARAMGMTTTQLNEQLDRGAVLAEDLLPKLADFWHNKYGKAAEEAPGTALAAMNRLSNRLFDIKATLAQGGFMEAIADSVGELNESLKDPEVMEAVTSLGSALGAIVKSIDDAFLWATRFAKLISTGWKLNPIYQMAKAFSTIKKAIDDGVNSLSEMIKLIKQLLSDSVFGQLYKMGKEIGGWFGGGGPDVQGKKYIPGGDDRETQKRRQSMWDHLGKMMGWPGIEKQSATNTPHFSQLISPATTGAFWESRYNPHQTAPGGGSMWENRRVDKVISPSSPGAYRAGVKSPTLNEMDMPRTPYTGMDKLHRPGISMPKLDTMGMPRTPFSGMDKLQMPDVLNIPVLPTMPDSAVDKVKSKFTNMKDNALQIGTDLVAGWKDRVVGGLVDGFNEYADYANNTFKQVSQFASGAFRKVEDALVDFVMTGKFKMEEFVNSILNDLARLAIRQAITGPLAAGMAGMFGPPAPMASGGVVNGPTMVMAGEGKFKREAFVPLPDGKSIPVSLQGGGGANVNVTVVNNSNTNVEVKQDNSGRDIEIMIDEMVAKKMGKRGSATNKVLSSIHGTRKPIKQR